MSDVCATSPNPNPGIGPTQNQTPDSKKGAHDRAKEDKKQANPQPMDPNNPTVASTDGSKTILDSIKQVDPGNIAGFIKKALDAMMMIRSIDAASGIGGGGSLPGGGASAATTSAAIGNAFINTAQLLQTAEQIGLKAFLDALNSIMPELIPLLDDDTIEILDQAILAVITNTNVGVLSPLAVQAANATAAAISSVQSLNGSSTTAQLAQGASTAAQIGGATLGLDPDSLAAAILLTAVGQTITEVVTLNGTTVRIDVLINNSYIADQLSQIPSFTGTEQQQIASTQGTALATQLTQLILSGQLTAENFLGLLQQTQQAIQNAGMQLALGTTLDNILGMITQLIPQFAGNIQDSENNHQPRANLETITETLQNHSKILSLIKKKLDISDIFQQISNTNGQASAQISSMMNSLTSAINGSGIAQALNSSDIVAATSTAATSLQAFLQSAQNPLQSLSSSALNTLVSSGTTMLNQLTENQVQSMLSALPPNLVMSLMGSGTTMLTSMTSAEINSLLATLPQNTVSALLQGSNIMNFSSGGGSLAEQTSDIAAALASVIATQVAGTILRTILPNGTTVTCTVI